MNSDLLKMAMSFIGPDTVSNAIDEITKQAVEAKRNIALLPGEVDLVLMIFEVTTATGHRLDCTICTIDENDKVKRQIFTYQLKELIEKYLQKMK